MWKAGITTSGVLNIEGSSCKGVSEVGIHKKRVSDFQFQNR
jgi:hypothetical protein